jgi:putative transposase
MARISRVVAPNMPHHVVQRGNRRQKAFFNDHDKAAYLNILKEQARRFGVSIWAYCLMDNHVHFVAVPQDQESLANTFGQTHRHYTRMVNFREGWRGYLWQGRFSSYVLDENYLYAVVRYIENNPVRAGLVLKAEDYLWSSARARALRLKDDLLTDYFLVNEIPDWSEFLRSADEEDPDGKLLESRLNTGRPLTAPEALETLERITGRMLKKLGLLAFLWVILSPFHRENAL